MKKNELDMNELLFVMSKCGYYKMTSYIKGMSVADNFTYLRFWTEDDNDNNYILITVGTFSCTVQIDKNENSVEYNQIPFNKVIRLLKDELKFQNQL